LVRVISGGLGELVGPRVDDRVAINVRDTGHDALLELLVCTENSDSDVVVMQSTEESM
jgi:hypothetical protein